MKNTSGGFVVLTLLAVFLIVGASIYVYKSQDGKFVTDESKITEDVSVPETSETLDTNIPESSESGSNKKCQAVFSSCSCSTKCVEINPSDPRMDCARYCGNPNDSFNDINPYKPTCGYYNGVCQDTAKTVDKVLVSGEITSVIIDFSRCLGKEVISYGLGSTSFEFKGVVDNKCELSFGTEIESPNGERSQTVCRVPIAIGKKSFNVTETLDLSEIKMYCS